MWDVLRDCAECEDCEREDRGPVSHRSGNKTHRRPHTSHTHDDTTSQAAMGDIDRDQINLPKLSTDTTDDTGHCAHKCYT